MEGKIELLVNHYIGDDFHPSRQLSFAITEDCLKDYLNATCDERTIKEFLDTYDSDESEAIYLYSVIDGRVLSEKITYCNDFLEKYNELTGHTQTFNSSITEEQIEAMEDYYWAVYAQ